MKGYPQNSLQVIDELNKYRLLLTQQFKLNQQPSPEAIRNILLKVQLLIQENQHTMNIKDLQQENTKNLLKLIRNERKYDSAREKRKFNARWDKKEKAVIKEDKPDQIKPKERVQVTFEEKIKKPIKKEENKNQIEFVSANSLPKGTSIRKRFVPPFKKEQSQPKKEKELINKPDNDEYDPRFKGIQSKLVQIIESEILQKQSKVTWSQIAGLGFAKKVIHEMIVWPMLRPDLFTGLRAPPKGILLFGPPGTGKTMIGRAIASEASATFFSISASSLTSKWVGQSEKLVKTLFAVARLKQPSVIFIDEIDSLLCARSEGEQESSRRVKNQFLVELDGAKTNSQERILVIGATNLPQQLDDAVRRRFVKRLYIPLPNFQGRCQLIKSLTSNQEFDLSEKEVEELATCTKGFSGADIYNLCSQASLIPLRECSSIEHLKNNEVPLTHLRHLQEAMSFVRPSVNQSLLHDFEKWNESYGSYQLTKNDLDDAD